LVQEEVVMSEFRSAVSDEAWEQVRRIGKADLLVGIPSFRNESTIGHVARAAVEGMARHFPGMRCVLMDSDGGSPDDTRRVISELPVPENIHKVVLTYQGLPGKGSAFRAIFEVARELGVKACAVVDSDLRSITPDWIRLLMGPVLEDGFGYVAPYYVRHKYDGTITNSIAYPLTRALYGVSVRQPIGGDFGFSSALLEHYLSRDVWSSDVARFGIDIWMTTTAINEGFRVGQAHLGAKIHDAKDPAASLGPMFRQVVGTLFGLMSQYEASWMKAGAAAQAPLLGDAAVLEPEAIQVTVPAMIERFKAACRSDMEHWSGFLSDDNLRELREVDTLAEPDFRFPADLWVRVVYDFAVAYNAGRLDPDRVVDSLTGLYYGRTASFCMETEAMSSAEVEAGPIDEVATRYEALKPYLLKRWNEEVGRAPLSG
jgi:glucosylglycerate synthase